jgi:hypothetical protein
VLGLRVTSSWRELFEKPANGDLKRKRKSGEDPMRAVPAAEAGTGVFEGVAWFKPAALGGAVCAPKAWKPSHRASSKTFAVLAWWCAGCISGPAGLIGVRFVGVWLFLVGSSDFEDLLFRAVGVAVACGSLDAGAAAFCGVFEVEGSGRSGISGRAGSPVCGEESAVIQLSSLDLVEVSGVGVGCYMSALANVNKPKMGRKRGNMRIPFAAGLSDAP